MPNETILITFVAVAAVALFFQAVALFALFISMRTAVRKLNDQVEELRSAATPVLYASRDFLARVGPQIESTVVTTRDLVARVSPRIETAVTELGEIAGTLKAQTVELQSTAEEVMERVRKQSSRVDAMLSGALDAVDKAGGVVADAVRKPLRQVSGIVASVKAVVESLRGPSAAPAQTHAPSDKDMFA